jgi:hypothetical protein
VEVAAIVLLKTNLARGTPMAGNIILVAEGPDYTFCFQFGKSKVIWVDDVKKKEPAKTVPGS